MTQLYKSNTTKRRKSAAAYFFFYMNNIGLLLHMQANDPTIQKQYNKEKEESAARLVGATTETEDQVESRFLLDVVIGKGTTIL